MMYVRTLPSNIYQVGGNSERIVVGELIGSPEFTHDNAVNLAAWLLGTVLLQSANEEDVIDKFRSLVAENIGRRSPV